MHLNQTHTVGLLVQVDNLVDLVAQPKTNMVPDLVQKDMDPVIKKIKIFIQGMVVNLVNFFFKIIILTL